MEPEIAEALRLLRGNATVLSPQEQRVLIDAVNFDVEMAPDMEYAQRSARLGARIDDPNTRIILVQEEKE